VCRIAPFCVRTVGVAVSRYIRPRLHMCGTIAFRSWDTFSARHAARIRPQPSPTKLVLVSIVPKASHYLSSLFGHRDRTLDS